MEKVCLIHIDVYRIIPLQGFCCNIILNRCNLMIHKQLPAVYTAGKAPYPVIHGNNIRIKRAYEVIQCRQRCNFSAGCHINVHPKSGQTGFRMVFRVSMHCHMAFVQMSHLSAACGNHRPFCNQQSHGRPLGFIILLGNMQYLGSYHVRQIG